MGIFDGVLICTDLDGTLLRNDKSISKENIDAIEYFKANGGLFTFVTGRMPYYVQDMYNIINPNAPFGCINGGGIYDHRAKEYVWTVNLLRSALELVQYVDERIDTGIQICTFEKTYFCKENSAMRIFRENTGLPNIICHYSEVTEPIAKVIFGDDDENNISSRL